MAHGLFMVLEVSMSKINSEHCLGDSLSQNDSDCRGSAVAGGDWILLSGCLRQ